MKTYIVKLVVVDDLGSWGPRTSTSTIFFGENYVCICTYVYISLKSQNRTESSILKKKKKKVYPLHCQKYMCFFFVVIVNVMFKYVVVITFLSISNTMYCLYVNGSGCWQMSVRIGLGNGLVLSGNKPLLEPILTRIYVAIWCHLATMS